MAEWKVPRWLLCGAKMTLRICLGLDKIAIGDQVLPTLAAGLA
jgi:hypothetical protein